MRITIFFCMSVTMNSSATVHVIDLTGSNLDSKYSLFHFKSNDISDDMKIESEVTRFEEGT